MYEDILSRDMTDPNISFLLTENKWGVFYLKEKGTGKIIGLEIITLGATGGHKVTFSSKEKFNIVIEEWNEPIPEDFKSRKE